MPRPKRVVAVGAAHHVTQRGNGRQDVFVNDGLRRMYLDLRAGHAGRNKLRVVVYCLMTNHAHLVVVPESERSLANTCRHAHGRFSQYWNTALHRTGHLWRNRFYSCPVEEAAEWLVVRYVEQNPVRAGMAATAAEYGWSSARAHAGLEASPLLDCEWWARRWTVKSWKAVLEESDEEAAAIRLATSSGLPYGSAAFVRALETQLGRKPERRKGGRPPRRPEESAQMAFWGAGQ
jgi:putative transposase